MCCFRFANFINNVSIINTFNSDNDNCANIKTRHCQIMASLANGN